MWCCVGFQWHVELAGQRGAGIFVDVSNGRPMFILQFRAVDQVRKPVSDLRRLPPW